MTNKEKCEELRKIRVKIAEDLGKPELVRQEPCNFQGNCLGTCPACYKEEEALMKELYNAYENEKILIVNNKSIENNDDNDYIESELEVGFGGITNDYLDDTEDEKDLPVFQEFDPFGQIGNTRTLGNMTVQKPIKPQLPTNIPQPPILSGMIIPPSVNNDDSIPSGGFIEPETKQQKRKLFSKRRNNK